MQRVMLFSEDRELKDALRALLPASRFQSDECHDKTALLDQITGARYRLVVLDGRSVGGDMDLVSILREQGPHWLLWLSPNGSLAGAAEAIRRGADFYLTLPLQEEQFQQVLTEWEREALAETPRWLPAGPVPMPGGEIVGRSEALNRVFQLAARVAPTDSPVLITGETGVGKELVARFIHQQSPRSSRVFVAVNCGAIPETLLESELFGFRKGAFTGAVADRAGLFEQANGGTFFLDEIGELSPALQVKFLRVLEDGSLRRLGGEDETRVNVRILAATHQDLQELVRAGRFREDLLYRINVIHLHVPPLRERRDDLAPLIRHFLAKYNQRFGRNIVSITRDALFGLMHYEYPGNVRELENIIQHGVLLADGNVIGKTSLPPQVFQHVQLAIPGPRGDQVVSMQKAEEELIKNALLKFDGNQTEAAKSLGISRSTLWRKIKTYHLENFK